MLSIQSSSKSDSARALVTLNYGICSTRISARLKRPTAATLDLSAAHWRKRLTEGGVEKWIPIVHANSVEQNVELVIRHFDDVLAELEQHSSDEALRDEWLTGSSPGLTPMRRMIYLLILLEEIGPEVKIAGVAEDLRRFVAGTVHQGIVNYELELSGSKVRIGER